jgi:hypothetical protein
MSGVKQSSGPCRAKPGSARLQMAGPRQRKTKEHL